MVPLGDWPRHHWIRRGCSHDRPGRFGHFRYWLTVIAAACQEACRGHHRMRKEAMSAEDLQAKKEQSEYSVDSWFSSKARWCPPTTRTTGSSLPPARKPGTQPTPTDPMRWHTAP